MPERQGSNPSQLFTKHIFYTATRAAYEGHFHQPQKYVYNNTTHLAVCCPDETRYLYVWQLTKGVTNSKQTKK